MTLLFENPANAIGLWLSQNDIEFDDIEVKHPHSTLLRFRVEFVDEGGEGGPNAGPNQTALYELFNDHPEAKGYWNGGKIRDDDLLEAIGLSEPDCECRHTDCDDPAMTYTIAIEIPIVQVYCPHHARRAAHHLFESDLEDYAPGEEAT